MYFYKRRSATIINLAWFRSFRSFAAHSLKLMIGAVRVRRATIFFRPLRYKPSSVALSFFTRCQNFC